MTERLEELINQGYSSDPFRGTNMMFLRVNWRKHHVFGGLQVRVCPKIGMHNIQWSCSPNGSGVKSQTQPFGMLIKIIFSIK